MVSQARVSHIEALGLVLLGSFIHAHWLKLGRRLSMTWGERRAVGQGTPTPVVVFPRQFTGTRDRTVLQKFSQVPRPSQKFFSKKVWS